MVSLGVRTSGVMGEEGLRTALFEASEQAGESLWPMPIPEEARSGFDSDVADLTNTGDRFGGMLNAAAFLREFVGERADADASSLDPETGRIPWAHVDIAGPAFNEKSPYGYTAKSGTGVMVRTLISYLESVGR